MSTEWNLLIRLAGDRIKLKTDVWGANHILRLKQKYQIPLLALMAVSLPTLRCFSAPSSTPSSSSSSSNYKCRVNAPVRITSCSRSASLQEEAIPSQIKEPPPPPSPTTENKHKRIAPNSRSGIQVPRQRYISISKSELLDAIVSAMFPSQEEARQFLSLSQ